MSRRTPLRRATLLGLVLCGACLVALARPASDWVNAIVKRDLERIEALLPQTTDVNQQTDDGRTALMLAAGEARHELVRALIERGARINVRNDRGGNALMYAASGGDDQSVALLLARGAEVNARARNGWTALTLAAVRGFDGIVTTLLVHGADANVVDIYGWTALMRAVQAERLAVVQALLASPRVDVQIADENGQTALHHAAMQNAPELARLLLARGARVDARDRAGRTAHAIAQTAGYAELVEMLKPLKKSQR